MSQKILIIGASSGIGKRMAELYVDNGDQVGITGRRIELLEEFQQKHPDQIHFEAFDVTGKDTLPHLERLVTAIGGLDVLIISSGTGESSKELSWEIDNTTVQTNVNGFTQIANWGFNYFVKQGSGKLATISSIAANRGSSWAPAYSASKAFQSNYFEGLGIKARKMGKGISVTCIEPGFVATKMARSEKLFWVVPTDKAARQIIRAIDQRRRKVYISRRWWIIAKLMKWMPFWVYKRVG
jgi:short-subunit dehydrogenase